MSGLLGLLLILLGPAPVGEYLVIAHKDAPFDELTRFQLQQIYLGKLDRLEGAHIFPVQTRKGDKLRNAFERDLFGKHFDVEDYWLRQKLLVGAEQPFTVASWALSMAFVSRNPGYVGYIPESFGEKLAGYNLKLIKIRE